MKNVCKFAELQLQPAYFRHWGDLFIEAERRRRVTVLLWFLPPLCAFNMALLSHAFKPDPMAGLLKFRLTFGFLIDAFCLAAGPASG